MTQPHFTAPATAGRDAPRLLSPPRLLAPPRRVIPTSPWLSDPVRRLLGDDGTAVALIGFDGRIRDLSTTMLDLLGVQSLAEVSPGSAADGVLRSFLDHIPSDLFRGGSHVWHGRVDHRDAAGDQIVLRATASAVRDTSDEVLAFLLHDITRAQRRMAGLIHRATHDPLTGLANRMHLLRALTQAIAEHREKPGHVGAIFLDLDHLKYVNDAFGHQAGDRLLVASARRLAETVRPTDEIGRIGGDEFLIVAKNLSDPGAALDLADRARRALTGRLSVDELDVDFSVSVGVALTDNDLLELHDDEAASALISNSDTAMYQSKQSGRGRSTLFTSQMRNDARAQTEMARDLGLALDNGTVDVVYQPIFSAVTKARVAVEALVRWQHPTTGRIDPARLVAVAEDAGLIGRLGEYVLDRALSDLAAWRGRNMIDETFAVHVNVSRVQLASTSFVNVVTDRLRSRSLHPRQLVLEARESAGLGRESDIVRTIRALRRTGVQVAIDNFGTGSKALSVLTDVGADVLKLDGSLALPSGSSESDIRLVRAIVLLAHALDIDVVAERVSGVEQLHRLQAAGCDMVQGNLLGQPVHAADAQFVPTNLW